MLCTMQDVEHLIPILFRKMHCVPLQDILWPYDYVKWKRVNPLWLENLFYLTNRI